MTARGTSGRHAREQQRRDRCAAVPRRDEIDAEGRDQRSSEGRAAEFETERERKGRTIVATAPTAAPEETPMMEGSAIGLRKNPCITTPAVDSAKPTTAPSRIRGRRTCSTIASGGASRRTTREPWSRRRQGRDRDASRNDDSVEQHFPDIGRRNPHRADAGARRHHGTEDGDEPCRPPESPTRETPYESPLA